MATAATQELRDIILRIIILQQNGMTLHRALDSVLGDGSYDKMVRELDEELRK